MESDKPVSCRMVSYRMHAVAIALAKVFFPVRLHKYVHADHK